MKTIEVRFVPQEWVGEYPVSVDPMGKDTWKVPVDDVKEIYPDTNESDELRNMPEAPDWVREWEGPFYVTWDEDDALDEEFEA